MRRAISRKARAPKGARVVCECVLPPDQNQATIGVFTGIPGFELAPYVNPEHLQIRSEKPIMHTPMYTTLRKDRPAHTFEFTADEDMFVQILQDIDFANDQTAKAKVHVHGKAAHAIRWILRDAVRAIRNRYDSLYRHHS